MLNFSIYLHLDENGIQNVPAALLIRFLREHRSEWADCDIDASAAAAFRSTTRNGTAGHSQLSLPLVNSSEQEEVLPPVHCTGFTFPDIECSFPACLEIAISHWT